MTCSAALPVRPRSNSALTRFVTHRIASIEAAGSSASSASICFTSVRTYVVSTEEVLNTMRA